MSVKDQVATFVKEAREQVEAVLDRELPAVETIPTELHQALRYAMFGGGKRLRPALALASCLAVGGEREKGLLVGAAFEMVHTYSLIHDDLPCMDDDDFRRGRPTCHKVHGEAMAVLAGDALLTGAFGLLAERLGDPRLVGVLARVAGSIGMVGGQALDLAGEKLEPSLESVKEIHLRKTAAMISGSLEAGALAGGAADEVVQAFARSGELMGLAFQIKDDLLDETADAKTLGKTPGKDREAGKQTWLACAGMDESVAEADRLVAQALEQLEKVGQGDGVLAEITRLMVQRRN